MTDIIDRASEREAEYLAEALAAARTSAPVLRPTGSCLWCEHSFEEGSTRRFCDAECRDFYELGRRVGRDHPRVGDL